jgi:uncharacterized protein (DUF3084 family)
MARDFKERGRKPKRLADRLSPRQAGLQALDDAIEEKEADIEEINRQLAHLDDEIRSFDNYMEARNGR